jgi:hypothetical protein
VASIQSASAVSGTTYQWLTEHVPSSAFRVYYVPLHQSQETVCLLSHECAHHGLLLTMRLDAFFISAC